MKTNDSAEKTIQELVNKKKSLKNEIKFLTKSKIKDYHVSRKFKQKIIFPFVKH